MKIIKTIQEISQFSSKQSQHITISISRGKLYKVKSHALKELISIASKSSKRFLCNLAQQLFWVNLMDGEGGRVDVRQSPHIVPSFFSIFYFDVSGEVFKDKSIHVDLVLVPGQQSPM